MMTGTRNATETGLPVAERSLEVLLDNVPDLIFFKDLDSRFTRVNAAFAQHVGLTDPRDALGKSDVDYFPPADAQAYLAEEHIVLTTGDALIGKPESRVCPDGETRWVLTNKVPIRDGDGRITGLVGISREITKRKAAEDALRQGEARFESLLRNALDIVTILGADGPVRYVSPAVERVLGYQPDELIGRNAIDLVHPEDQSGLEAAFNTALNDPMCIPTVEFRFPHKNGTWRWLETTTTNLLADPRVRGVVVNSRDITERKAVEEALRQSESGMAEAQRLAHIGSWEWDIASNHVTWSDELYRIVGTTRDEFVPSFEGYLAHVHPEDRLRVQGIIVQALANRQDFEYELRMVGTDGVVNFIYANGVVILDSDGRVVGFRGTDQDISARKRLVVCQ